MGVFHVFKIVQMVPNRAKHYIYMNAIELISLKKTPLNSWCLREMRVSLQQQLGSLFCRVKFPECKVHDIHHIQKL